MSGSGIENGDWLRQDLGKLPEWLVEETKTNYAKL